MAFQYLDHPPAHVTVEWGTPSEGFRITCAHCHKNEHTYSPSNAAAIVQNHAACAIAE